MAKSWYVFMGGTDPSNCANYFRVSVKHSCLCGDEICAIYSNDDGQQPTAPFSRNLLLYIATAVATGTIQPEVPINSKKYVYLKLK